jgi:hypothetical protein
MVVQVDLEEEKIPNDITTQVHTKSTLHISPIQAVSCNLHKAVNIS